MVVTGPILERGKASPSRLAIDISLLFGVQQHGC